MKSRCKTINYEVGVIKNWSKTIARVVLQGHDPNFLIIGAQKSGTSTLHYLLDQHPKIHGSFPKEIHYFSTLINYPGKDLEWYRKHFTSFSGAELYFETTPNYFYNKDTPRRIHEYYPDVKLIVLLRDPVKRAFSAWNMYHDYFKKGIAKQRLRYGPTPDQESHLYQYFFKKRSDFPSFLETIEAELTYIEKGREDGPNVIRKGLYYEQLNRYYEYFPKDQLFILGFNDLAKHPDEVCQSVLEFIGKGRPGWRPKVKTKNKRKYDCSMTDEELRLLQNFYSVPNLKLFDLLGLEPNW